MEIISKEWLNKLVRYKLPIEEAIGQILHWAVADDSYTLYFGFDNSTLVIRDVYQYEPLDYQYCIDGVLQGTSMPNLDLVLDNILQDKQDNCIYFIFTNGYSIKIGTKKYNGEAIIKRKLLINIDCILNYVDKLNTALITALWNKGYFISEDVYDYNGNLTIDVSKNNIRYRLYLYEDSYYVIESRKSGTYYLCDQVDDVIRCLNILTYG